MNYIEIENKKLDTYNDADTVYEFKSPIFNTIDNLMTSRTYSMKFPTTAHNLSIFEWCNNPKSKTSVAHRELSFREYRQNKLFMSGIAYIDYIDDDDINVTVVGGVCAPMKLLHNLKLRDLQLPENSALKTSILWNDDKKLLTSSSASQVGFVFADFGSIGTPHEKLMPPSVNFAYILQALQSHINNHTEGNSKPYANFEISVPANIKKQLDSIWVPLLDNNNYTKSNNLMMLPQSPKYLSNLTNAKIIKGVVDYPSFMLFGVQSSDVTQDVIVKAGEKGTVLVGKSESLCGFNGVLWLKYAASSKNKNGDNTQSNEYIKSGVPKEILVTLMKFSGRDDYYKGVQQSLIFPIQRKKNSNDDNGESYICKIVLPNMQTSSIQDGEYLTLGFQYRNENEDWLNNDFSGWTVLDSYDGIRTMVTAYVKHDKVQYGDYYPIVPNLPDIAAKEFLECLMNMFCTYFVVSQTNSHILQMKNVSDILFDVNQKTAPQNAMVWDGKELCNSRKISFCFGDYAQKNKFSYSEDASNNFNYIASVDDSETIDASLTMQGVLPLEKNKFTLPFAPSQSVLTTRGQYAIVPLFKKNVDDENMLPSRQNIKYRIGRESKYMQNGLSYKSMTFDKSLHFGSEQGLLNTYHKGLAKVMHNVFVIKTSFLLNAYDIACFDITKVLLIDGVSYLILDITFMSDNIVQINAMRV